MALLPVYPATAGAATPAALGHFGDGHNNMAYDGGTVSREGCTRLTLWGGIGQTHVSMPSFAPLASR